MSNLHIEIVKLIEEKPHMDYASVLPMLGVTMLKAVEMSSQEAVWILLRQEMSENSRDVIYIPTCFPVERIRVRKTKDEMGGLPDASTDVWKQNIAQKYESRRSEVEQVCDDHNDNIRAAVQIDVEQDAYLIANEELLRVMKARSSCAAFRKRGHNGY